MIAPLFGGQGVPRDFGDFLTAQSLARTVVELPLVMTARHTERTDHSLTLTRTDSAAGPQQSIAATPTTTPAANAIPAAHKGSACDASPSGTGDSSSTPA